MADANTTVHIGENSPEEVAYKLLGHVMSAERRAPFKSSDGKELADRKYLLDTYAECLQAVRQPWERLSQ